MLYDSFLNTKEAYTLLFVFCGMLLVFQQLVLSNWDLS